MGKENVSLITCFECFEHMDMPLQDIDYLFSISNNIIFSTELYSDKLEVKDSSWWYYGLEQGQHITFYSKVTLDYIAKKYNVYYYRVCGLHWFTDKKVNAIKLSFVNTLYRIINKISKINYKFCNIDYNNLREKINKDKK